MNKPENNKSIENQLEARYCPYFNQLSNKQKQEYLAHEPKQVSGSFGWIYLMVFAFFLTALIIAVAIEIAFKSAWFYLLIIPFTFMALIIAFSIRIIMGNQEQLEIQNYNYFFWQQNFGTKPITSWEVKKTTIRSNDLQNTKSNPNSDIDVVHF